MPVMEGKEMWQIILWHSNGTTQTLVSNECLVEHLLINPLSTLMIFLNTWCIDKCIKVLTTSISVAWSFLQCATFPIDRGPGLGKNWVGLGKLSNLVARGSMVISCVLLDDSITGLQVYTVGLWWIFLTLDRWSMTSANTISHTIILKFQK